MGSGAVELSPEAALSHLAAAYGIEPGFHDARGRDISASPETQRKLLKAMRVEAETDHDAAQSLDALHREAAARPLPPVVVARQDDSACHVEIVCSPETTSIDWLATLEDGSARNGTAEGSDLVPLPSSGDHPARVRIRIDGLPWGYHKLRLPAMGAETVLIVTPGRCWLPDALDGGSGLWGMAVQLYLLRSASNWGIGDFSDLKTLVQLAAKRGCAVIGLNPLHQMFLDNPEQASPYSPATRLFLNALYIAVPDVPDYAESAEAQAFVASEGFKSKLEELRSATHVDYAGVTALKLEALRLVFATFSAAAPPERKQAFATFLEERAPSLSRTSIFQALRQHFAAQEPERADWHNWPAAFQDFNSEAVLQFADEHRTEVDFLSWLQWVADGQLGEAAQAAEDAGMVIRLYRDLAVGCDQSGAETWTNPDVFLRGAQVGAPPDIFNPAGQNWGLPPLHPQAMREEAYASFTELIRANMRHAGGLRIDHVMGLQHLYCIPQGDKPTEGAYVDYPIDDMLGVLALESQRHRCLVVGEDLGTVPEGFRERMAAANVLSYRVLFFEQDWDKGTFLPPDLYPRLALAVTGSHDLPTLDAWWKGGDISLKDELKLYPDEGETASQWKRRDQDRHALVQALREQQLVAGEGELSTGDFARAAHSFLARTGAALVVPQLDDILGEFDPVNVPGTTLEYPNWRRKYRKAFGEISDEDWSRLAEIAKLRGDHSATGD